MNSTVVYDDDAGDVMSSEALDLKKGSYILIVKLDEDKEIAIGSLGVLFFPAGFYAYLGSALGGFKSRISRHLRKDKRLRWHVDYLLREAEISNILLCETRERLECSLFRPLADELPFIAGFGSSDCGCPSHLYFAEDENRLLMSIGEAMEGLGLLQNFWRLSGNAKKIWSQEAVRKLEFSH